jgi:hypothetical protein
MPDPPKIQEKLGRRRSLLKAMTFTLVQSSDFILFSVINGSLLPNTCLLRHTFIPNCPPIGFDLIELFNVEGVAGEIEEVFNCIL